MQETKNKKLKNHMIESDNIRKLYDNINAATYNKNADKLSYKFSNHSPNTVDVKL